MVYSSGMTTSARISYVIMAVLLVMIGWLHLATLVLTGVGGLLTGVAAAVLGAGFLWRALKGLRADTSARLRTNASHSERIRSSSGFREAIGLHR